jgi:hypothetical protein
MKAKAEKQYKEGYKSIVAHVFFMNILKTASF